MDKKTWPKTEAGTIDWEVVFENPETGLIPLISGAKSAGALRDSALAVIKLLYTHIDDPPEIERFTVELQSLIPDDTPEHFLPRLVEGVTAILRQIKDERIRKTEEYAGQEGVIEAVKKRDARMHAEKAKKKKTRTIVRIAGGAALAVLGMIVYLAAPWEEKDKSAILLLIDQMKAAAGDVVKTHVFQGRLQAEVKAGLLGITVFSIPPDACSSAAWYFINRGSVVINGQMPKRVSPYILAELCGADPNGATLIWVTKQTDK
jgi:hypothetical protein